jgi:DNA-binding response OmpR family regulator
LSKFGIKIAQSIIRAFKMYYQKSRKILIIDPDREIQKELLSLFSSEGYQVEISEGVTDGLQKLKDIKFDCLIMDVELPEMKGYQAFPLMRTVDPKIDVIMTAARNTPELEARVREQDIFYYYIKSFGREELWLAVRAIFKKLGKIKEVRRMNGQAKILIVDDDPAFVEATTAILKSDSYKVEAAYDKEKAMEKIKREKPDLILLDVMMQRLDDGFTMCYKLKHDPELKPIPVLMITGVTKKTGLKFSPQTDGEYLEADDYVDKPVKAADLLKRVKKLLPR